MRPGELILHIHVRKQLPNDLPVGLSVESHQMTLEYLQHSDLHVGALCGLGTYGLLMMYSQWVWLGFGLGLGKTKWTPLRPSFLYDPGHDRPAAY